MLDTSRVEGIAKAQELVFPDSTLLYQRHFTKEAIRHPAKCNLFFLNYIISKYTVKGDVILDCCAGTGSTGLVGGLLGRESILIDVEPRYVAWMTSTFNKASIKPTILLGDARTLREGLRRIGNPKVNVIIFSPPYADMLRGVQMVQGGFSYGEAQVGRLPLTEYLAEIEKIYRECYAVLGKGDRMILIVRNYIRRGSVVDLVYETYALCTQIGFRLDDVLKLKLPRIRRELIQYYKSHPYTSKVLHEYALVFLREP